MRILGASSLAVVLLFASAPVGAQVRSSSGQVSEQVLGSRAARVSAQDGAASAQPSPWTLSVDGVAFGTFNRQGGPRGTKEFNSQNWLMAMGMRSLGRGMLTLSAGVSAEPFSVPGRGYAQLFQEGEAYQKLQVTDHQHPHDLFMQLAAAVRVPVGRQFSLTLAGGPVGEPALGPVAFIHRPSSAENPTAPLSHHIFDSTHIAAGVMTVGLDRGPIAVEASAFRGRESDEQRKDFDLGAPDSWSARLWYRQGNWLMQGSYGFLNEPEELEPGDQRRTTGSVSWMTQQDANFTAVTVAAGRTVRTFSTLGAFLAEVTHKAGRTSVYSRVEARAVESEILLIPGIVHRPHAGEVIDAIQAVTAGAVRDVWTNSAFELGVGGDLTFYGVPDTLTVTHNAHPVSAHVFVRVRPRVGGGRMWNMAMGQPMGGASAHDHAGMMHP